MLALPLMVIYVADASLRFADAYIVSHLGVDELAAIFPAGVASQIFHSFGWGFFAILGTFVSQSIGKGNPSDASAYSWNAVWFALFYCAVVIPIGWLFAEQFFRFMDHSRIVQEHEVVYFRISLLGLLPAMVTSALTGFFTGVHKTRFVAIAMLASIGLNIVLTYLLVFGVWIFPELGVAGAAMGTVIAVLFGMLIFFALFLSRTFNDSHATRTIDFSKKKLSQLTKLGVPGGLQLAWQTLTSWVVFTWMIGLFGTAALAATNIVNSYMTYLFMPAVALGVGLSASVGMAIGENRHEVANKRAHLAFWATTSYLLILGLGMLVFKERLLLTFTTDSETLEIGSYMFFYAVGFQVVESGYVAYTAALRGAGDTRWIALASIAVSTVFLCFVGYYLVTSHFDLGPHGPWLAKLMYAFTASLFMIARWRLGSWRKLDIFE